MFAGKKQLIHLTPWSMLPALPAGQVQQSVSDECRKFETQLCFRISLYVIDELRIYE